MTKELDTCDGTCREGPRQFRCDGHAGWFTRWRRERTWWTPEQQRFADWWDQHGEFAPPSEGDEA